LNVSTNFKIAKQCFEIFEGGANVPPRLRACLKVACKFIPCYLH